MNEQSGDFVWDDGDSPEKLTFFGIMLGLSEDSTSHDSGFEDGNIVYFDVFAGGVRTLFFKVWHGVDSPFEDVVFDWIGFVLAELECAVGKVKVGVFFESNDNISAFIVE